MFRNVLDAACGSGLHTIILDQLGVSVTGIDISGIMIRKARENAELMNANPVFIKGSFLEIEKIVYDQFDIIFILGNSLVHILENSELAAVLAVMKKRIVPEGRVVIQILNYSEVHHFAHNEN